ncbi:hypothetical protein [Vibrio crassostreae]|uniref:Uncharacterized protein n=1 Tax=Vibrio crassostreae TaxID=246167 RepID=A0ABP1WRM8_9VIBR|nr:hypothetical protein [Vibrio crassostreae]TCL30452.1 hypothetical protein EDB52_101739 [Vibrio crassostreae]TCT53461.1 hypothetical protein EDB39_101527 [Vibrio crassostreae]TCT57748.1 hypothetical protein EDB40_108219 [Vibrio crassostreae]CAK1860233.1 conserved membrane hypothetical protein [Vibrio crassostreae]CAK1861216.1 conserved membrane hypothetical protein [Vibrio crassostreae]
MSGDSSLLIGQINKYKGAIKGVESKNYKKHVATRKMSLVALVGFFISFSALTLNKFYSDGFLSDDCLLIKLLENNAIMSDFVSTLVVITIPAALYLIVFSLYESTQNKPGNECNLKFYMSLLIVFLLISVVFSSPLFFMAMCTVGVILFVLSYGSNRYFGYTRAWVRNRAVRFHIERLLSEHELSVSGKAPFMVEIEEQALQKKFYTLVDKNIEQQQKDIVGDHLSVGDATLSWIKGLKK